MNLKEFVRKSMLNVDISLGGSTQVPVHAWKKTHGGAPEVFHDK